MNNIEFLDPERWLMIGGGAFLTMIVFRAFILRHYFRGRATICFTAGLALFSVLVWWNFDQLIDVPQLQTTGSYDTHILSTPEMTIHYYMWYAPVMAFAIGSVIDLFWLLVVMRHNHDISGAKQARIFGLSMGLSFVFVMLLTSFVLE